MSGYSLAFISLTCMLVGALMVIGAVAVAILLIGWIMCDIIEDVRGIYDSSKSKKIRGGIKAYLGRVFMQANK